MTFMYFFNLSLTSMLFLVMSPETRQNSAEMKIIHNFFTKSIEFWCVCVLVLWLQLRLYFGKALGNQVCRDRRIMKRGPHVLPARLNVANPCLWQFGSSKLRLTGLSIKQSADSEWKDALRDALHKRAAKSKRGSKTAPVWFKVKGVMYIGIYRHIQSLHSYCLHTCIFHFWLQATVLYIGIQVRECMLAWYTHKQLP